MVRGVGATRMVVPFKVKEGEDYTMMQLAEKYYRLLIRAASSLQSPLLLAVRLYWGWQFMQTGCGKLTDIGKVVNYFTTLGIPAPVLNAYFISSLEFGGGLLLILGLGSRLIALPLAIDMLVAYITADREALLRLRQSATVDYAGVAEVKWRALRAAFESFKASASAERRQRFEQFRVERGALLSHFACFEALRPKLERGFATAHRCRIRRRGRHEQIRIFGRLRVAARGARPQIGKPQQLRIHIHLDRRQAAR